MGNVLSAGLGQNPARQAALEAGIPESVPATTVNKVCGSGLKAVALAAQAIRAGDARVVVAGGMENMSAAPHLLPALRAGQRMGDAPAVDSMIRDGLWCASCDVHMGVTAENVAERGRRLARGPGRLRARASSARAAAIDAGAFDAEIVPVSVPARRGEPVVVARDEHPAARHHAPRRSAACARRSPTEGTVTAGTLVGHQRRRRRDGRDERRRGRRRRARPCWPSIRGYASVGVAPRVMGLGPVGAVQAALDRAGVALADIGVVELNEAFAAQSLAVSRPPRPRSGADQRPRRRDRARPPDRRLRARVLTTLLHEMVRRDPARPRRAVHRRRPGDRDGRREGAPGRDRPRRAAAAGDRGPGGELRARWRCAWATARGAWRCRPAAASPPAWRRAPGPRRSRCPCRWACNPVRVRAVGDGGRAGRRRCGCAPLPRSARRAGRIPGFVDARLQRDVERLAAGVPAISGVYVQHLVTGCGAGENADAQFPAASTLKAAILVDAVRRGRAGRARAAARPDDPRLGRPSPPTTCWPPSATGRATAGAASVTDTLHRLGPRPLAGAAPVHHRGRPPAAADRDDRLARRSSPTSSPRRPSWPA